MMQSNDKQSNFKQTNHWTASVITAFLLAEIVMIAILITGTGKRTTHKSISGSAVIGSAIPVLALQPTPNIVTEPNSEAASTQDEDLQKSNLLSMTFFGVIVTLLSVALFFARGVLEPYLRYCWSLPPIAVAAYVFVCNFLKDYQEQLPNTVGAVALEVTKATVVCAALFGLITFALIGLIAVGKRI